MRTLYDFRPEQSTALKKRIADLEAQIAEIRASTDREMLTELLVSFYSIPESERSYVRGYWILSDAAKGANIDIQQIADTTTVIESPKGDEDKPDLLYFSDNDRKAVDSLPKKLTTEHYVLVTTLLDKLLKSEDFEGKENYLQKLTDAKEKIAEVQAEIDSLNAEIIEKLYPFESIYLRDKKTVDDIVERYERLSEYDRAKIDRWEDVIKAKTQIDNTLRGIIIAVVLCIVAVVIAFFLICRIRKKRKRRETEMEEFAALYEKDDE